MQDVYRRITTKKETSTRIKEKTIAEITRIREKSATLLKKKILMRMMMKLSM